MFCSACGCEIYSQDDDVVRINRCAYPVHATTALCIEALLRGGHTIPVTPRLSTEEEAALREHLVRPGKD